jgi:hypothetical protein
LQYRDQPGTLLTVAVVLAREILKAVQQMSLIVAPAVVFIGLVFLFLKLTSHFASPQPLPVTAGWIDGLSIDRYRPMLRLLDEEEVQFLRAQPGFTAEMVAKFRIQRCRIFRQYLRDLDDDFKRICMALKVLIAQSKYDRPELASLLFQNQMTFAYGMMMARFQSVCYRYGVGTVDVTCLLKLFDGMRLEVRTLVPAESWAGA